MNISNIISEKKIYPDKNGTRVEHIQVDDDGKIVDYFRKSNVPCYDKSLRIHKIYYDRIEHEYNILDKLHKSDDPRKDFIVKPQGFYNIGEINYLLLEFLPLGDIFSLFAHFLCKEEVTADLGLQLGIHFTNQLIQALSYIHSHNLIYGDIKLENSLLTKDAKIKFCDFATALPVSDLNQEIQLSYKIGTAAYLAPEMLEENPIISQKYDIYALGICIFRLFFPNEEQEKTQETYNFIEEIIESCDDDDDDDDDYELEILKLIFKCLDNNPKKRPNINELLEEFSQYREKYFNAKSLEDALLKLNDFFDILLSIKHIEKITMLECSQRISKNLAALYDKNNHLLLKHNFEESGKMQIEKNQKIQDEIKILDKLNHPNIIKIKSIFQDGILLGFTIPYVKNLHEYYENRVSNQKLFKFLNIALTNILDAIIYIHSHAILHGNLNNPLVFDVYEKSHNDKILINVVLKDFSNAVILNTNSMPANPDEIKTDIILLSHLLCYMFLPRCSEKDNFDFYPNNTTDLLKTTNQPLNLDAANIIYDCRKAGNFINAGKIKQRFFMPKEKQEQQQDYLEAKNFIFK